MSLETVEITSGDAPERGGCVTIERTQKIFEFEENVNFPSAAHFGNGAISLTFSVGRHMINERTVRLWSADHGETWQPVDRAAYARCLCRLQDGRRLQVSGHEPPARKRIYPLVLRRYRDPLGEPEIETVEVELPFTLPHIHCHRSLIRLGNGELLLSAYQREVDTARSRCFVLASADDGRTWTFRSELGGFGNETEPVLELGRDGSVLALVRTRGGKIEAAPKGPMLQTHSRDGGRTWAPLRQTASRGVDPCALLMSNGALVVSYGRPGISLLVDYDGIGQTWDECLDLYLGPGCSYTSLVEVGPDRLMLFYTESSFGNRGSGNTGFFPLDRMMAVYLKVERGAAGPGSREAQMRKSRRAQSELF